jgi:U4/U6 small nuclear ribonucleoprotein PRP4
MANLGRSQILGKDAIALAVKAGNVNLASSGKFEVLDLNEESLDAQRKHALVLQQFETQKRARSIIVPTDINEVKQRLRELGKPVTLFGEGHQDRRDRLKDNIAALELGEEEFNKLQVCYIVNTLDRLV